MDLLNPLYEKLILPTADIATGQTISKFHNFLMKSQWWSLDKLQNFQLAKLKQLIHHSYNTVPYYRNLFDQINLSPTDISTLNDLQKIPLLTKETIQRQGFDKFVSNKFRLKKIIKKSSSGSTGQPLKYFTTKEAYSVNIAANLRGWYWMGFRLGDKFLKIDNSPRNTLKKIQDSITRNKCISFTHYNPKILDSILYKLQTYNPKIVRAYPSLLSLVISHAKEKNYNFKRVQAINTTGNVLHNDLREQIQNLFQCLIFDSYSCEGGANAFECETHECYHSAMEYAITEIVDRNFDNQNLGRAITTDLWNYAMPFIRYDSQDYIEIKNSMCSCGRNLLAINKIHGRDTDILISVSGKRVSPHTISIFFKSLEGVNQFKVVQNKVDEFHIFLKADTISLPKAKKSISQFWDDNFGKNSKILFEVVKDIPFTQSGKSRYIIRSKDIVL